MIEVKVRNPFATRCACTPPAARIIGTEAKLRPIRSSVRMRWL